MRKMAKDKKQNLSVSMESPTLNNVPKWVKYLPLLGVAGGLYYAYSKGKTVPAYFGFAVVGAIVFSAPYNYYLLDRSSKDTKSINLIL